MSLKYDERGVDMNFGDIVGHSVRILMSNNTEVFGKVMEYDSADSSINLEQHPSADSKKILGYRNISVRKIKMIEVLDYKVV